MHVPFVGLNYRIHGGNSHKRGISFDEFHRSMSLRWRAIFMYYAKYCDGMEPDVERILLADMFIELCKMLSLSFPIVVFSLVSVKQRLSALGYSSRFVYALKQKFYGFFVGR